jgi:thioredoxin 1
MTELTVDTFDEHLAKAQGLVVVDFWAPWCGPCKQMNPVLDTLISEEPEVSFVKVNVDEHPQLAGRFGVRAIPTFLFFRNGELLDAVSGARPLHEFRAMVGTLK